MNAGDLEQFEALLAQADRVVPMRDIWKGDTGPRVIGLRHDVDNNAGSFDTAIRMAEWEFERGYSSTYYLLHGSWYWADIETMLVGAEQLEDLGHEVGIHVNAIAEGLRRHRDPRHILRDALAELRTAVRVEGCVAHGDPLCRNELTGEVVFCNDEMFTESPRPTLGEPDRTLALRGHWVRIRPCSRSVFGLMYDANWLPRGNYLSDSGGKWSQDPLSVHRTFGEAQLHVLQHPDWWAEAFSQVAV